MTKVLWLDVDGVLLDWLTPFLEYSGLYKEGVRASQIKDYDMSKLFKSSEQMYSTIEGFSRSSRFRELPVLADKKLLIALKNSGFDLKIITKIPYCSEAAINRLVNLSEFGAIFSEVVLLDLHDVKCGYLYNRITREAVRPHAPHVEHIVIEDAPDFLFMADGINAFKTYGIIHEYNKHIIPRLDNVWMYPSFNAVAMQLLTEVYDGY